MGSVGADDLRGTPRLQHLLHHGIERLRLAALALQPPARGLDFVAVARAVHAGQGIDGPGGRLGVAETSIALARQHQLLHGAADAWMVDRRVEAVAVTECGQQLGARLGLGRVGSGASRRRGMPGDGVDESVHLVLEDRSLLAGGLLGCGPLVAGSARGPVLRTRNGRKRSQRKRPQGVHLQGSREHGCGAKPRRRLGMNQRKGLRRGSGTLPTWGGVPGCLRTRQAAGQLGRRPARRGTVRPSPTPCKRQARLHLLHL